MSVIYHRGLKTSDTDLMCALTACGVELDWAKPCEEFRDPARGAYVVFYFQPMCRDGEMDTAELIAAWEDKELEWIKKHPRHPLSYMKMFSLNRKRGLDLVKSRSPIAVIREGDKNAFLSLNAAQKTQDLILGELHL